MSGFERYLELTEPGSVIVRNLDGHRFLRLNPGNCRDVFELSVASLENGDLYHMNELLNIDDDFLDLFEVIPGARNE